MSLPVCGTCQTEIGISSRCEHVPQPVYPPAVPVEEDWAEVLLMETEGDQDGEDLFDESVDDDEDACTFCSLGLSAVFPDHQHPSV